MLIKKDCKIKTREHTKCLRIAE